MKHQTKISLFSGFASMMNVRKQLNKTGFNILMPFYHTVSDDFLPHISKLYKHKSQKQFEADLDFLQENFDALSAEDLLKGDYDKNKQYFFLSFDDGLKECYSVIAPILKSRGIPAAFFINPLFIDDKAWFYRYEVSSLINELRKTPPSDSSSCTINKMKENEILRNIEKLKSINYHNKKEIDEIMEKTGISRESLRLNNRVYLKSDELKSLSEDGFYIGAHSMTHPLFSDIDIEKQTEEVIDSLTELQKIVKTDLPAFAFPYSDYGLSQKRIKEIQMQAGLKGSFGTSGHGKHPKIPHFQRMPMEHGKVFSASRIIKTELLVSNIKKSIGR